MEKCSATYFEVRKFTLVANFIYFDEKNMKTNEVNVLKNFFHFFSSALIVKMFIHLCRYFHFSPVNIFLFEAIMICEQGFDGVSSRDYAGVKKMLCTPPIRTHHHLLNILAYTRSNRKLRVLC